MTKAKQKKRQDKEASPAQSATSMTSGFELNASIRQYLNVTDASGFVGLIAAACKGNPLTVKGKRKQMAKMILLTMTPVIALTFLTVVDMSSIIEANTMKANVRDTIKFSTQVGTVVHFLQKERDMTALYLATLGPETKIFLRERYPDTDKALRSLSYWPGEKTGLLARYASKEDYMKYIEHHRKNLDPTKTDTKKEVEFYTETIRVCLEWIFIGIQMSEDGDAWRDLVAYQLMIMAKEDIGIERSLGGIFYSKGKFNSYQDFLWYIERHNVGVGNFKAAQRFTDEIDFFFNEEESKYKNNFSSYIDLMRGEISRNNLTGREPSWEMSTWWFDNMTIYIDILYVVQNKLVLSIVRGMEESLDKDTEGIAVGISLFLLVIIIIPVISLSVRSIMNDIQKYALVLADQTSMLNKERKRTDSLLYQMIPKTVAQQLKKHQHVAAESFDECTVFFSDVIGFTALAKSCTPMQVIALLNDLYVCFDTRIELWDVYKVETIGDAYMVVSGVPTRNGRRHVYEICTMALDLNHHINHLEVEHMPDLKLHLRVGIHSGTCVAGVVGLKMPRYCLFGDTVNTASRMESNALPGKIHISPTTQQLLSYDADYIYEKRGEVHIKGKGLMETFWLKEKKGFIESLPCMPLCQYGRTRKTSFH